MKIPNYFKDFLQYAWVYSLFPLLACVQFFILNNRGIFIRNETQYKALVGKFSIKDSVQNQLWLLFAHYIMKLQNE